MEDVKPEEKSPLLLYVVEGEGNASKNNKRVNFDKGRLYGISSGATAVFTEFPNYISPCWITTLLSSLIFLMMVLLMVSAMSPSDSFRVPRCIHRNTEKVENKTIHLVHYLHEWNQDQLELLEKIKNEYEGYDVHLVLLRPPDQKPNQVSKLLTTESTKLKNISATTAIPTNPTAGVNQAVIEIKKAKRSKRNMRNIIRKKRDHLNKIAPMSIGFSVKNLLDILLRSRVENPIVKRNINASKQLPNVLNLTELFPLTSAPPQLKTLDDVITNFPSLTLRNITTEEAFSKTPLQKGWFKLNRDLVLFAVRVLHLWQYGGMSFKIDGVELDKGKLDDVDNFSVAPRSAFQTMEPNSSQIVVTTGPPSSDKLLSFVMNGRETFEDLPNEVVAADDEALHIFTKSPCHVFFGELLMNLKRARGDETPKNIIQKSLVVFCKHSAVGRNYCKNLIRKPE